MKNNFFCLLAFLFFLFSGVSCFSQQAKTIYFDAEWKVTTKENAAYYRKISYDKSAKPLGVVRDYYISGKVQWEGFLKADKPKEIYDNINTWYYPNGRIKQKSIYRKGLQEAEHLELHKNGKTRVKCFYVNGKIDGDYFEYYSDGSVQLKKTCRNDEVISSNSYEPDGRLLYTYYLRSSIGHYYTYYYNGVVKDHGVYPNKNQHIDSSFYPSGKLQSICSYKNGELHGTRSGYHENGVFAGKESFTNGKPNNDLLSFYPTGIKHIEEIGLPGRVRLSDYDSSGRISKAEIKFKQPSAYHTAEIIYYYGTGIKKLARYRNGDGPGIDSVWYPNGVLQGIAQTIGSYTIVSWNDFDSLQKKMSPLPDKNLELSIGKDLSTCFYGLKNNKGKWVLKPEFSSISFFNKMFFLISKNSKHGLIDVYGRTVIEPLYDNVLPVIPDQESYYSKFLPVGWSTMYPGGWFIVTENKKHGIINPQGKIVIPIEYEGIVPGKNGFTLSKNKETFFSDLSGNIITEEEAKTEKNFNEVFDLVERKMLNKNLYGLKDKKGNAILAPVYKGISLFDKCNPNLVSVKTIYSWGLVNEKGKFILDTGSYYSFVEKNSGGLFIIKNRIQKFGVINCDAEWVLDPVYEKIVFFEARGKDSVCGSAVNKNQFVFFNRSGKIVSSETFEYAGSPQPVGGYFERGGAWRCIVKKNGKYGIIDQAGAEDVPIVYDDFQINADDVYLIKDNYVEIYNRGCSYGKRAVCQSREFENEAVAFYFSKSFGLLFVNGKFVPYPQFKSIISADDYFICEEKNGKKVVMDVNGNIRLERSVNTEMVLGQYKNGYAPVYVRKQKAGIIDLEGKLVVDTAYLMVSQYDPRYSICWVKTTQKIAGYCPDWGGWGLVNNKGKFLLDTLFSQPAYFCDSMAVLEKKWKYGAHTINGKEILPFIYDEINYVSKDRIFFIKKDSAYGMADKKGKIIVAPQWRNFCYSESGFIIFRDFKNNAGLLDARGKIIIPATKNSFVGSPVNIADYFVFYNLYAQGEDDKEKELYPKMDLNQLFLNYDTLKFVADKKAAKALRNFFFYWYDWYSGNANIFHKNREKYSGTPEIFIPEKNRADMSDYSPDMSCSGFYDDGGTECKMGIESFYRNIFSVGRECEECSYGVYSGSCQNYFSIQNYLYEGDSLKQLSLDMIFDKQKNYRATLNTLLLAEIQKNPVADKIDCANPNALVDVYENNIAITPKGLLFYFVGKHLDYQEAVESSKVLLPYSSIKNILDRRGALSFLLK